MKSIGMNNKVIQRCKGMEGMEGCVVLLYNRKQRRRRRRNCRRIYVANVVFVKEVCSSGVVGQYSSVDVGTETYKEFMARNERYHMYLEVEHPR
jgi:hypothetical protein